MSELRVQAVIGALLLSMIPGAGTAQQDPPQVTLGGLRVPSCNLASDPEYGLVKEKAIQIGGGPLYMAAREQRYLNALRGPGGQTLRWNSRGSAPLNLNGDDHTIIDIYPITYEGQDKPIALYLDAYHFSTPKAPQGFTCGVALASALGTLPIDPFSATPNIVALAIEQGSAREFAPVPLEASGATKRGVVFDQFRMIAFGARTAAASGSAWNPNRPPGELSRQGLVVLAYPLSCDGRTVAPQSIEILGAQGPLPRNGDFVRDQAIETLLPGIVAPASSLAARYALAFLGPTNSVKITYGEADCESGTKEALLPVNYQQSRLVTAVPPVAPAGVTEADPTVYLQAIIDTDGRFERAVYVGGPESLTMAARETIRQWRAQPVRVNNAPVVSPIVLQVTFR